MEETPYVVDADDYFRIAVKDTRDCERLLRDKFYKIPRGPAGQVELVLRVVKHGHVPGA